MLHRLTYGLLVAVAIVSGCSGNEKEHQAITQLIETRSKALNSRNTTLYLSTVSPGYSDKDKGYSQLKESIINNFKTFESLSYQSEEHAISVAGNLAEASGTYRMRVIIRGRELLLDGMEHLKLAKGPEGWKIIGGL